VADPASLGTIEYGKPDFAHPKCEYSESTAGRLAPAAGAAAIRVAPVTGAPTAPVTGGKDAGRGGAGQGRARPASTAVSDPAVSTLFPAAVRMHGWIV
jgi:hypothetical protein